MRHSSYAAAAASAVGSSSSNDLPQQPSTGTSPSMCSSGSPRDERDDRKHGSSASTNSNAAAATQPHFAPAAATPPPLVAGSSAAKAQAVTVAPATAPVGANPGTVKLLKEQFERQSSDGSLPYVPRPRIPVTASAGTADSRGNADEARPWELLTDAQACAEVIQQLLQEKKELQKQVDSLWSQKEAFRCANERISRVLLREQQQRRPEGAIVAAAEAAGATPRKGLSRRPVNVVPSGSLTSRGPRGPRVGSGALQDVQEIPRLDLSAMKQRQPPPEQQVLQHPKQRPQSQQQKKALGIPGMTALNMKAVDKFSEGLLSSSGEALRGQPRDADALTSSHGLGSFTCRASLASSALKTPRRRFGDGGISARTAGRATVRLGSCGPQLQQRAAVEQALVASMRSMNLLNQLASGGSGRKTTKTKGGNPSGETGRAEFTPETALYRCSSNPEKGYWHTTFLCVLKVEGTDLFLDVTVPQNSPVLKASQRAGSSFFSNSSETPRLTGALVFANKETAGVFQVCVRHLLKEDNWLRSIVTTMYWGLTSGVDSTRLPPDQTLEHGLSLEETQAGAMGTSRLSSTPSESGNEDDGAAAADSSSCMFSGWDAVAFMYQRSIDEMGNTVPGKVASPTDGLYISTRTAEGSSGLSVFSSSNLSVSSTKSNKSSSSNGVSSFENSRRAELCLSANQLILQSGQTAEQLFIVRAKDRLAGVMPLYHQATQKYLCTHPTLGVVGLVPPVMEQERRMRMQQNDDQQQFKRPRRRWRARRHQENRQQQQKQEGGGNSSAGSSPKSESKPVLRDTLLRPCRIEMIPLADLLLQQSVQRVLSTVQEAALQQQLLQQQLEQTQRAAAEEEAKETARSVGTSSQLSSDEEDSFDGIVASEGGEEVDPSKGTLSRRCKPLVPPLGIASPTAAASADLSSVSQVPGPLEFKLDDEGVETDVEEGGVRHRSSSNTGSSNRFSDVNNSSSTESYYWPTSVERTKQ